MGTGTSQKLMMEPGQISLPEIFKRKPLEAPRRFCPSKYFPSSRRGSLQAILDSLSSCCLTTEMAPYPGPILGSGGGGRNDGRNLDSFCFCSGRACVRMGGLVPVCAMGRACFWDSCSCQLSPQLLTQDTEVSQRPWIVLCSGDPSHLKGST